MSNVGRKVYLIFAWEPRGGAHNVYRQWGDASYPTLLLAKNAARRDKLERYFIECHELVVDHRGDDQC